MDKKEFEIEITKHKLPAIWEKGCGRKHSGFAQIITSPSGEPKVPTFINHKKNGQCINHALIILNVNDVIIRTLKEKEDVKTFLFKVTGFDYDNKNVICEEITEYSREIFGQAINTAVQKVNCYHCDEPHFIKARKSNLTKVYS